MILTLDQPQATDPLVSGAKAAWLARARQAGLPVLDGIVVPVEVSKRAMALAMRVMEQRGSGGARLAITGMALPDELTDALEAGAAHMPEPMVVRSSTLLEERGEWSGAFTSYLDINHGELATAVKGCWASSFTVHTLERFKAAGVTPGSASMAVMVQPLLTTNFGGTARISGDDVLVVGVAGSPAPLVQGWEPGAHVRVGPSGKTSGEAGIELLGSELPVRVADVLRSAHETLGVTSCEWGSADGAVTLFQVMRSVVEPGVALDAPAELASPLALQVARAARRAPGPLGEALILPWALAAPDLLESEIAPVDIDPMEALRAGTQHAATLTAAVWSRPKPVALSDSQHALRALRSSDPGDALAEVGQLRRPDPDQARLVLGLVARVREALVAKGAVSKPEQAWHIDPASAAKILGSEESPLLRDRIGFDRWEPFDAGVVLARGTTVEGTPAAPGVAVGRLCFVAGPGDSAAFRARDVLVGTHPLPNHAALLWDAAALVTTGGGPGAHLFESARALAIPAVCGIHLDEALEKPLNRLDGTYVIAVDGSNGTVAVMPW